MKNGIFLFAVKHKREKLIFSITTNPNVGQAIGSFLKTGIEGKSTYITKGPGVTAYERVECQVKRCVTHSVLLPSTQGRNIWVLSLEVMLPMGYVKRILLFRECLNI